MLKPMTTTPVYGITPEGFNLKRLYDIQQATYTALRQIQDPVSGEYLQIDPAANDPLVQLVNTTIASIAETWELAQVAYNSRDPLKATGAALDEIGQELGLVRRLGTFSVVSLYCTGTSGFSVEAGVGVTDGYATQVWYTNTPMTFGSDGTATVTASPAIRGVVTATSGTLTAFVASRSGWSTVINPLDAVPGEPDETDQEYRRRILLSSMVPSSSPVDSLYSAVASVSGVTYCRIYQNRTLTTDSRGLKPKSVAAVVVGGDDTAIAQEIYLRSAAGLDYNGNVTKNIQDFQGIAVPVSFYRPTNVPIFIKLDVRVIDATLWHSDGVQQIKDAIVLYAHGGAPALDVYEGFTPYGFTPGATVVYTLLFTPINSVPGVEVAAFQIGLSATTLGTANIPTEWNQVPFFDTANMDITIVT